MAYQYLKKKKKDFHEYFNLPYFFTHEKPREPRKVVIIDTETTGINPDKDELLSISLVECTYDAYNLRLVSVDKITEEFREPSCDIPEKITALTGLSREKLQGRKFNDYKILEAVRDADYLIAHNAAFDRSFLFSEYPSLYFMPWKCSLTEIEWHYYTSPYISRSLTSLCAYWGFTYDAHRATNDVLALLSVLRLMPRAVQDLLQKPIEWRELYLKVPLGLEPRYLQKRGFFRIRRNVDVSNDLFYMKIPYKKLRDEIKWLRKFFHVKGDLQAYQNGVILELEK